MNRATLLSQLFRIKPEQLNMAELNLGLALLLNLEVELKGSEVFVQGQAWNPMENWQQFGQVLMTQPIVVASHQDSGDDETPESPCYFTVHAYFGGLEAEGWDYRLAVAQCCIKLLEHKEKYKN